MIETVHKDVSFHYAFFYRRLDDGTMAGHGDGRKFLVIRGFVQLKSGRKIRMKHNFNGFRLLLIFSKFARFIIETLFCYVENATYCILFVVVSLFRC